MAATGPRNFSMQDVKSRMGNYASTNFYHVYFLLPSIGKMPVEKFVKSNYDVTSRQATNLVEIACIDTTLPGSSFATHEITNDFYGITERHAYRRQFDGAIDFTFAVDRNYTLLRLFEGWMGYIGGETTPQYDRTTSRATGGYKVPFRDDYVCNNLSIVKYEKDVFTPTGSRRDIQYNFVDAFPISVATMPISQGPTDLLTITVTMNYQKYYTSKAGESSAIGVSGWRDKSNLELLNPPFASGSGPTNDTSFNTEFNNDGEIGDFGRFAVPPIDALNVPFGELA